MPDVPQQYAGNPQGQPGAFPPTVIAGDRERFQDRADRNAAR
jgi:hypothetical protein